MKQWMPAFGNVEVTVTSADPARFLSILAGAGIQILGAEAVDDLTVRLKVKWPDYSPVCTIAERNGIYCSAVGHTGIYWTAKNLLARPVLVLGFVLLLALSLYLPTRILFVQVDGNADVPTRLILEKAADCGIHFFASRRDVRSEKMKNALLSAVPQLQWAGVNTKGCTAVITVRERQTVHRQQQKSEISSLIASRDGVISAVTATKGNALCAVGDAVRKGQVLISGYLDSGLVIRGCRAEGEVFADTHRDISVYFPSEWTEKGEISSVTRKYGLLIGKKLIKFEKDSGILPAYCDRIYEENYMVAPGGFRLPVAIVVETVTTYETKAAVYPQEDARRYETSFAREYLKQQMIAGDIITDAVLFEDCGGAYRMDGQYACREMIGQVQKEEIITPNGNSD